MPRRLVLVMLLLAGCGAEEFGLRPPRFALDRKTAVVAFFASAEDQEPEQILAFDLRQGPVRFGFRSESISEFSEVVALGYNETLEEFGLLEGAITRPQSAVQCVLTTPAEIKRVVLGNPTWTDRAEAPRVLGFITGDMMCGSPANCRDLKFTRSSPIDREIVIETVLPIERDKALVLALDDVMVASPGTITSTGFPDFYRELPRRGSTRARTGESYFFEGKDVVRVNVAFTEIEYRESFADYRIFGLAASPDGQRLLAFTSTHKSGDLPPHSVRIWLRENGGWSILLENNFVPSLVPTTSPIAWRNNNEAYVAFRAQDGNQGILYRYRNDQIAAVTGVPGPAGVVVDDRERVFVGSSDGVVYLLMDDDTFETIGGTLEDTFHGLTAIEEGVLIGGVAGRLQEVYPDKPTCPVQYIASGIVNRIQRNGDGYLASGVLPSFILWSD